MAVSGQTQASHVVRPNLWAKLNDARYMALLGSHRAALERCSVDVRYLPGLGRSLFNGRAVGLSQHG